MGNYNSIWKENNNNKVFWIANIKGESSNSLYDLLLGLGDWDSEKEVAVLKIAKN